MAHANTEQFIAAWSTLDERDLMILRKMGASLIGGTHFSEPLDLISEAFDRCLNGRRNWSTNIPFSVFLGNVMRSIAHAERRSNTRNASIRVDLDEYLESMQQAGAAPSAEEVVSDAQQVSLTQKAADDLRAKLAGDDGAQKVLSGMVAGLSPKEMRESFHMDSKAFEAALARVMRRARVARMH